VGTLKYRRISKILAGRQNCFCNIANRVVQHFVCISREKNSNCKHQFAMIRNLVGKTCST